jgi:beta-galactosidase
MHYWRVPRARWRACLEAMRDMGLDIVETYAPWSVHERGPGDCDWRGQLDLGAFLDAAAAVGMRAIVRPGPHINAELTGFGFPERVLRDRRNLAVTARGTPAWLPAPPRMFPVPSYASRTFQREVRGWLAAVAEIVRPRLWPDGPVVAIGVDNEAQMFFRLGAFDCDYHDDALAWWAEYAPDAGDVEPPRAWPDDSGDDNGDDDGSRGADVARCLRWVRFKEVYVSRTLAWLAAALDEVGLSGVARFHNLPPSEPTLVALPAARDGLGGGASHGVVGMDFYHRSADYAVCRRRALYLVGSAEPLPYAPELGVGGPPWLPPVVSPADSQNAILGALAAGVRAFNLYMTVARERWYGAPIADSGDAADPAQVAWLRALLATLREVGWTRLRRRAQVALIATRAEARVAVASSVADPITPVVGELLGFGPAGAAALSRDADAALHRRWDDAIQRALALAQVAYEIVDEGADVRRLSGYRAVIAPTLDRVDRGLWRRLRQVAATGVVVVAGPREPTRDELDQPLGRDRGLPRGAGLIRAASLRDLDGLADDLAALADPADAWFAAEQVDVDCAVFATPDGAPRVVFAGNAADQEVVADVVVPPGAALRDPFTGERLAAGGADDGADDIVDVAVAPHQVRMFVVEPG